jgi:hypothetical protein
MGDEVMYFRQGHDLYLQAVVRKEAYKLDINKHQPVMSHNNHGERVLLKGDYHTAFFSTLITLHNLYLYLG